MRRVARDVDIALDCIGIATRQAREAVDEVTRCTDEGQLLASIAESMRRMNEIREHVEIAVRDVERLREALLAHYREAET